MRQKWLGKQKNSLSAIFVLFNLTPRSRSKKERPYEIVPLFSPLLSSREGIRPSFAVHGMHKAD